MKIKDIALSAAAIGERVVKAIAIGAVEVWSAIKYIIFKDPVVEQICATNWGDGVGITEQQAAAVTDIRNVFQGNRDITSFDEFALFRNVKSLRGSAFYECINLGSILLPDNLETIGVQTFQSCGFLSFKYPKALKSIERYAFMSCGKITKVYADSLEHLLSVQYANDGSFPFSSTPDNTTTELYINDELLVNADIQSGITQIPGSLFLNNKNIISVSIPNTVTDIGSRAFFGCRNLTSDITIPSGVSIIKFHTFQNCSSVASFTLQEGITAIEGYAFSGIGTRDSFVVPSTVTNIGGAAFFNSTLKNFVCLAVVPPTASNMFITCESLYVPDESVEAYKTASNWSTYASKIKPLSEYQQ